jgi:hypothetical protein
VWSRADPRAGHDPGGRAEGSGEQTPLAEANHFKQQALVAGSNLQLPSDRGGEAFDLDEDANQIADRAFWAWAGGRSGTHDVRAQIDSKRITHD